MPCVPVCSLCCHFIHGRSLEKLDLLNLFSRAQLFRFDGYNKRGICSECSCIFVLTIIQITKKPFDLIVGIFHDLSYYFGHFTRSISVLRAYATFESKSMLILYLPFSILETVVLSIPPFQLALP